MQSCLKSTVPVCITVGSLFLRKNWNAKLSLTICIRITLLGEPVRCLLSLNCADIRLFAVKQAKVCPYLLRNAVIDRPNQAWSIDITYISMKQGFLYLTAIIDWYSRCIVGWDIDDTLDTTMVINACKKAFKAARPLIIN